MGPEEGGTEGDGEGGGGNAKEGRRINKYCRKRKKERGRKRDVMRVTHLFFFIKTDKNNDIEVLRNYDK